MNKHVKKHQVQREQFCNCLESQVLGLKRGVPQKQATQISSFIFMIDLEKDSILYFRERKNQIYNFPETFPYFLKSLFFFRILL